MIDLIRKYINGEELTKKETEQVQRYYGNKEKPKGFGDTIASITKAVGIKPCGGCKKRQEKLNKMFPYK